MRIDLTQFRATFIAEAREHLQTIEQGLLQIEGSGDPETLDAIFRAAHSIKGASGMFGFAEGGHLVHAMEGVLDCLRQGMLAPDATLVDVLLRARDALATLVDAAEANEPPGIPVEAIVKELERWRDSATAHPAAHPAAPPAAASASAAAHDPSVRVLRIGVAPAREMMAGGIDPLLLLREVAELGELLESTVDASALPALDRLVPEHLYLTWTLRLRTAATDAQVRDVFLFVEDEVRVTIEEEKVAEVPAAELQARAAAKGTAGHDTSWIRVPTERVDELINLVGELIIAQSMVTSVLGDWREDRLAALQEAVGAMERNVRDLQERIMSVRMMPVASLFSRFPRLVRDTAALCGKQVKLELSGTETELDKSVIEQLGDPLTHLLRNAVDHGVESPERRLAAGKPAQGTVQLAAAHEAGNVIIEVSDDGAGLDVARIRAKAVERGIVAADAVLTDDETHALIFAPGFSTAEVVSEVSGRGVGMDVVRRNIEALGGSVSIHSVPGQGTRFRVRLPLTLAILDGMQVRVGSQVFVLPLLSIVETFHPRPDVLQRVMGRGEFVKVRGEPLPLVRVAQALGVADGVQEATQGLVVLVEHGGGRAGLLVDELLGQSQVVIKNVEENFGRIDGVMAATIMGDGRVAMILDVDGLVALARRNGWTPPASGLPPLTLVAADAA